MAKKKIGTIRKREGVSQKTGKEYSITSLVFEQGVKILLGKWDPKTKSYQNFQEVNLGDYRSAEVVESRVLLEGLFKSGKIDEAEYEKRSELLETKGISRDILLNVE